LQKILSVSYINCGCAA